MLARLFQSRSLARQLILVAMALTTRDFPCAQQVNMNTPSQGFAGYPPAVYMNFFLTCPKESPCIRTDNFRLDTAPHGCCLLLLTNGDGRGHDEVRNYEIFLNGDRVVPSNHSRNTQAEIKLQASNSLKVLLSGDPKSKVFILIAYDPRKAK